MQTIPTELQMYKLNEIINFIKNNIAYHTYSRNILRLQCSFVCHCVCFIVCVLFALFSPQLLTV